MNRCDVFDGDTLQHLGLYEACAQIRGRGVEAKVFAGAESGEVVALSGVWRNSL